MDTTTTAPTTDAAPSRPAPPCLPTSLDEWRELWALQAATQDMLNMTYALSGRWDTLALARQIVEEECAPWAQYDGHHDGWQLFQITVRSQTKGGTIEAGDVVLGTIRHRLCYTELECWSFRKASHCTLTLGWKEA